jgi:hypothetical protein
MPRPVSRNSGGSNLRTLFFLTWIAGGLCAADEAATLKWVQEEHLKLVGAARADGLFEEARDEIGMSSRAKAWADPSTKVAAGVAGRLWMTRWDDAMHRKYLAFVEKRRTMRKAAASKFVTLGIEIQKNDPAKAELAWKMALVYDDDNRQAHERLGEALVDKQGWFTKDEAEKRKKGLLPIGNDWLPAKEVEARRSKWAEAWVVRGEHFEVTSNHSLAGAQHVLARAEEMYHAMMRELDGLAEAPQHAGPMKIYYFAARADLDEHNRTAHGDRPALKQAPGFFSNEDQVAHFFPVPSNATTTLEDVVRHEGAHQVSYFLWKAADSPQRRPHFWVWEGWGTYFESVQNRDGKIVIGNAHHARVKEAREKAATLLPLEDFVKLDQAGVAGKYPQCAALALFFMNADDGKYREKFVEYVRIVHEARAEAATFETVFGRRPKDFQAEWTTWLRDLR